MRIGAGGPASGGASALATGGAGAAGADGELIGGAGACVGAHAVASAIADIHRRPVAFNMKAGVPRRGGDCKKRYCSGQTMAGLMPELLPHGVTITGGQVPLSLVTQLYESIGSTPVPGDAVWAAMMRLIGQQIWSFVQQDVPQHVVGSAQALAAAR